MLHACSSFQVTDLHLSYFHIPLEASQCGHWTPSFLLCHDEYIQIFLYCKSVWLEVRQNYFSNPYYSCQAGNPLLSSKWSTTLWNASCMGDNCIGEWWAFACLLSKKHCGFYPHGEQFWSLCQQQEERRATPCFNSWEWHGWRIIEVWCSPSNINSWAHWPFTNPLPLPTSWAFRSW